MRYEHLKHHATVFLKMTGLHLPEWDKLVDDLLPEFVQAEQERLSRPDRQRDLGGGRNAALVGRDQVLLTVVWLRVYPTHEVLGYLFGVSDSTVSGVIARVLPLLEQTGAIVDISDRVGGPTADINLLEQSGLMNRLPEGSVASVIWPLWASTSCMRKG
jgi:hypothetical protein